jgi:hypothetical protein
MLTPEDLERCTTLQTALLQHFSPTLFQAPAANHMACTDALADAWLTTIIPAALSSPSQEDFASEVGTAISPAIDAIVPADHDQSPIEEANTKARAEPLRLDLGKPLETLLSIERMDWGKHRVCDECAAEKRVEWQKEREAIWEKMDEWLGLSK